MGWTEERKNMITSNATELIKAKNFIYLAGFIWGRLGGNCWSVTGSVGATLWRTLLLRMT